MITQVEKSFLVVIDVQQRLMSAMPESDRHTMLSQLETLIQAANLLDVPVSITEQYPKGLGATESVITDCVPDVVPLEKTCFSCVGVDEFMTTLRSSHRRSVILTGVEAHICVLQTAFALHAQGYHVSVVEDAVTSRNQANKDNALYRLRQADVVITNVESVIFEWLGDAQHPQFKTLSKLLT